MNKIDKFYEVKNILKCPQCGKKIRFHAGGLVCKKEHRFDISSKGYVNFMQENRVLKGYDSSFFASRARFMQAGYYEHIIEAVCEKAEQASQNILFNGCASGGQRIHTGAVAEKNDEQPAAPFVVIDAGCGEGSYSSRLSERLASKERNFQLIAFDISADAVKTASKNKEDVKWLVADITNIPVKDRAADCILDIFTPANYSEFNRILKPEGTLIKVIPAPAHLQQLRQAAGALLRSSEYSGEEVSEYFEKHFEVTDRLRVSRTSAIGAAELEDLVRMTPLLFDIDKAALDLSGVREITIAAEILVGKARTPERTPG